MLRPWIFVGFTGHRRLKDSALVTRRIEEALTEIEQRSRRPLAAVSSVASGADTLFGRVVVGRELPWEVLLPLPREEFARDFSPEEWVEAEQLMAQSTAIEEDRQWQGDPDARNECYLECGVRTVDGWDVFVAVWDGKDAVGKGGTGDVVTHARQLKVPLVWIHAESGAVQWERGEALPQAARLPQ